MRLLLVRYIFNIRYIYGLYMNKIFPIISLIWFRNGFSKVIENQFFPKFKKVQIILGGGGGSRKLWTFPTIYGIFCSEPSPKKLNKLNSKKVEQLSSWALKLASSKLCWARHSSAPACFFYFCPPNEKLFLHNGSKFRVQNWLWKYEIQLSKQKFSISFDWVLQNSVPACFPFSPWFSFPSWERIMHRISAWPQLETQLGQNSAWAKATPAFIFMCVCMYVCMSH